jgi:hypothetical protein
MRGTETTSRSNGRPAGVSFHFQVCLYKVEPSLACFACNLLAKDDVRAALADEPVEGWPEVPLVIKPAAFACRGERLAGAGAGPHGSVVGPPCLSQGVGPDTDTGEEVALGEGGNL